MLIFFYLKSDFVGYATFIQDLQHISSGPLISGNSGFQVKNRYGMAWPKKFNNGGYFFFFFNFVIFVFLYPLKLSYGSVILAKCLSIFGSNDIKLWATWQEKLQKLKVEYLAIYKAIVPIFSVNLPLMCIFK